MPRKKELPVPDSSEQDDLLSAETQELPNTPLPDPHLTGCGSFMRL